MGALVRYSSCKNCLVSSLPQGSTYSLGVAGNHLCSINDAIPMQFRSTEDAASPAFRTRLIDGTVCNPAAPQHTGLSAHRWEAGWPSFPPLVHPTHTLHSSSLKQGRKEKSPFSTLRLTSEVLLRRTCPYLMMVTLIIGLSTRPEFNKAIFRGLK